MRMVGFFIYFAPASRPYWSLVQLVGTMTGTADNAGISTTVMAESNMMKDVSQKLTLPDTVPYGGPGINMYALQEQEANAVYELKTAPMPLTNSTARGNIGATVTHEVDKKDIFSILQVIRKGTTESNRRNVKSPDQGVAKVRD